MKNVVDAVLGRHLLLYFDVNKTVIMHDPVQGKDLRHILNDLLTESCYGRILKDSTTTAQWQWNGTKPCPHYTPQEGEITYGMFLRHQFPTCADPLEARQNKNKRKIARQSFTAPGQPGEDLASEHCALLDCLRLPADPSTSGASTEHDDHYHFILPAFLRLIQQLHESNVHFNLVFRTYGNDLHRIAEEFNAFCEGRHPHVALPEEVRLDGTNGGIDRRILFEAGAGGYRFGTFFRDATTTALIMGTFDQPEGVPNPSLHFYEDPKYARTHQVRGHRTIYSFLTQEWRQSQATLALRDFYPHWFAHQEDASAGKLLLLDPSETSVVPLFFDDNILPHDPHIVDARDVNTGEAVPFEVTKDRYLLRVEPLQAVREVDYFLKRLEDAFSTK
ncbi:TPA: hypothetical protein N0F65_010010 [Lagenidium giganteum]|uniref:Uncharacterized protein n=1 Tax=Lagenidium giganteum TaxID=4803 RepID=A0AAV2ZHS5_9STRA|nr:TPA: hypothetical protein N0F65_010010 [Lagenidium giganteum]